MLHDGTLWAVGGVAVNTIFPAIAEISSFSSISLALSRCLAWNFIFQRVTARRLPATQRTRLRGSPVLAWSLLWPPVLVLVVFPTIKVTEILGHRVGLFRRPPSRPVDEVLPSVEVLNNNLPAVVGKS